MRRTIRFYKNLFCDNWLWIKRILWWGLICFVLGIFTYILFPQASEAFLRDLISFLVKEFSLNKPIQGPHLALHIFLHNLRSAGIALFLGLFFGIAPLFVIGFNIFLIGALTIYTLFVFGLDLIILIFPHGIFELPALFIAGAFGLRFGFFWKIDYPKLNLKQKFWLCLKQNLQLVPLITLLLAIAAFVEIYITPNLPKSHIFI